MASSHSARGSWSRTATAVCGSAGESAESPLEPPATSVAAVAAAGAAASGAVPVVSRMESMMSDFFVRADAFRPSALAIAKSWSLSFDSRTDCSSASAATGGTSFSVRASPWFSRASASVPQSPTPPTHGRGESCSCGTERSVERAASERNLGRPPSYRRRSPIANTLGATLRGANFVRATLRLRVMSQLALAGSAGRGGTMPTTGREHMHRRTLLAAVAVTAGFAGLIPAAMAGATTPPTSGGGEDPYCAAHLALEQATNGDGSGGDRRRCRGGQGGRSARGGRRHRHGAGERSDRRAAKSRVHRRPTTPSSQYVRDNCGFNELHVLAKDYSYGGIGGEVAAGPTIVDLDNQGTEYHEIFIVPSQRGRHRDGRRAAGAAGRRDQRQGHRRRRCAFAAPGTVGHVVVDLTPGDYIALCFIPKGSTPEAVAEMMAAAASAPMPSTGAAAEGTAPTGSGGGEEGPPHFTLGMYVEFTVVEGGTTETGSMRCADGHDDGDGTTGRPTQPPAERHRSRVLEST